MTIAEWSILLEDASVELHRGASKTAFDKACQSLESCYTCQADVRDRNGNPDYRLNLAIKSLFAGNRISREDHDLADHLRKARNVATHPPGFEPSADEVARCIDRVRSLCAQFGGFVRDVMVREVKCARPDEPITSYVRMMRDDGISQFPVLDGGNRVIGTLDEKCVFDAIYRDDASFKLNTPVSALMRSKPLPTIDAETSLVHARKRMHDEDAPAFIILEDGRLDGLITKFDLMF